MQVNEPIVCRLGKFLINFVDICFKGIPGPGKYDITRTFDSVPPIHPDLIPIEQPPFLTQAKVSLNQLIIIYLFYSSQGHQEAGIIIIIINLYYYLIIIITCVIIVLIDNKEIFLETIKDL